MARTLNGNYTGRAARTARAELMEEIREAQEEQAKRNERDFYSLLAELKAVDPDWEEWFDETDEIPEGYWDWYDQRTMDRIFRALCKRTAGIFAAGIKRQIVHAASVTNARAEGI